jgi:penicillin-binding protein 2
VTPHLGKAIISAEGNLIRRLEPKAAGRVPASATTLKWLRTALRAVTEKGTGRGPFLRAEFPLTKIPVASKTGTGEVYGKQSTSWFASYAPAHKPRYAVVMMVSQGGTGSGTSGPAVAEVYKTLFGVNGQNVNLANASPPGGRPPTALPEVRGDGTIVQPGSPVRNQAAVVPPYRREDGP